MNLKDIVAQVQVREEWQDRYQYFIPLFLQSAIDYQNWQDWDQEIFKEFFEKSNGQCVSSLQQSYFTKEEQNNIKLHWSELAPLLRELARSQTQPNWELYKKVTSVIRQYTSKNMQAATNRLIASLQPQLLCTIVADDHLKKLYNKLQHAITEKQLPTYQNDWFKNSYHILRYFKDELGTEDSFKIMTYPWQLKDEWLPKGYDRFHDVVSEAEKFIIEQKLPFKMGKISHKNFVWIADEKGIIGNTMAHYEFLKKSNIISVDLHFEENKSKDIFHKNIKQLPEKLSWKKWESSQSISYSETFNLNEENVAHKLVEALIFVENAIGDKVRDIIKNADKILNQSQLKDKMMNEKINLLQYKKQIILQGPPGTGKTREAELIAKEMLGLTDIKDLENNNQYKLVQFHPSYTYEDFVRGIIAVPIGTSVIYESANKILGKFAKDALSNYTNSKKSPELISKESWVSEKYELFKDSFRTILEDSSEVIIKNGIKPKIIAVEDDSLRVNRYSNENDSILVKDNDIILAYIGLELSPELIKIRENSNLSKSARSGMSYVYQNLVAKFKDFLNQNSYNYTPSLNLKTEQLRQYIFIIDEINRANLSSVLGELIYALEYRGKEVESMYEVEGSQKLILPPNLYIIGTMNTADRSVGHIDYAIRRRFAFVDVLPEELNDDKIVFQKELFKKVSALFINNYEAYIADKNTKLERAKTLAAEFRPEDVWLGHSYFIQTKEKDKDGKDILVPEDFNIRLEYEIKPILMEYVKDGILINTIKVDDRVIKVEDYIKAL